MLKIGITGQSGFVGTHLYNTLGLFSDKFERIPFQDDFFADETLLHEFVKSCDVIVHLAAMNRHHEPETIYNTNVRLVRQLIKACEDTHSTPHIIFSSSTQEERDNLYGKSKREGRQLLEQWAEKNKAQFTGFIIPNVFGPFGRPYYNSVIATFCHQLTHGETPRIEVDSEINLIYVGDLVNEIIKIILAQQAEVDGEATLDKNGSFSTHYRTIHIPHHASIKVSQLLEMLEKYKKDYFENGSIPSLDNPFHRNLWNTFICYLDHQSFFPFYLKLKSDERGDFVEMMKLNSGGQVSFSTTKPGVTRGNHFHTRKAERFAVIKGKARIEIRRIGTDKKFTFFLDGTAPSFVDMPIWFTHNITNIGDEELYTIFWISEHFDPSDPDTYFEKV
jgi:UDP-2-acetamido-2,6-beta-L-arabino-hexul-4-ose reductase